MEKELVVAYYNEDLNWLNNHKDYKISIYNKSNNEIENTVKLTNIGRETHTYFNHIINNYDNLSDWTFFTQANPFDHVLDYEVILKDYPNFSVYNKLKVGDECFFFSNGVDFKKSIVGRSDGSPYHWEKLNVNSIWEKIFINSPPPFYNFTKGAIFTISKNQIKIRSLEFYEKCLNCSIQRESAPWEMERIIPYIFNPEFK